MSIQEIMKPRFVQNSLLVVSSLLLTIISIDFVAFFIWDIKPPGYKRDRFFEFSPLFGWTHQPNSEGYWYRYRDGTKYYVSINRHGFADSERDVAKKRPRIALIGDSTTEFWEADIKDRGQYVIEELLNREFEVLNFGVRGYGTDQTYLLFRNKGVHFSPDIVVYTFCINDIWDNANPSSKPYFDLDPSQPGGIVLKGYSISNEKLWHRIVSSALRDYSFT